MSGEVWWRLCENGDVGNGSVLEISTVSGYASGSTIDGMVRNDGLINVGGVGPAGPKAFLTLGTPYDGTGLVSVRGAPGSNTPPDVRAVIGGPASGTFDVASGKVEFDGRSNTAAVNFLDDAGELELSQCLTLRLYCRQRSKLRRRAGLSGLPIHSQP